MPGSVRYMVMTPMRLSYRPIMWSTKSTERPIRVRQRAKTLGHGDGSGPPLERDDVVGVADEEDVLGSLVGASGSGRVAGGQRRTG